MHLAIVIPAFNEAARLPNVLSEISNTIEKHTVSVLVVDDGSRDTTSQAAKKAGKHLHNLTVIRHKTNLGKGAAAKTGCDAAVRLKAEVIILMDADGQHQPADIVRLVAPIAAGKTDLVIGSRENRTNMPAMMRLGNRFLTTAFRLLFRLKVHDTQSGYRAFRTEVYPAIRWVDANYAMETEMLMFAANKKVNIVEVPIATVYLDNHKGTTVLDGVRILISLLVWKTKLLFHFQPAP